jgi:hypothetical protein
MSEKDVEVGALVPITPMSLIARAQETNASIEQMQQLFELQIRYEENEAKKAYHKAVAAFKTEVIKIVKDKKVGYENNDGSFTGYTHVSLGNVINTITPFLSRHGLSLSWDTIQQGGDISTTCTLTHELGHSTSTTMQAQKDNTGRKNAIQQVASTISYLQRYTALAITGLAAAEQDDDAVGSEPEEAEKTENFAITDEFFKESLPKWEENILSGKRTAAQLITFLEKKGTVFADHHKTALKKVEEQVK